MDEADVGAPLSEPDPHMPGSNAEGFEPEAKGEEAEGPTPPDRETMTATGEMTQNVWRNIPATKKKLQITITRKK